MRLVLLGYFLLAGWLCAQPAPSTKNIAERTANWQKLDGYLPLYWDAQGGKLWMEVPRFGEELLYIVSLPAGIGSNDIGLDRGQTRGSRIVRFERYGNKVMLVEPNYRFRAVSDNADERRSVEDAFAKSVLAGFTLEAEQSGRALVDATTFFLQDAHGVAGALQRSRQGTYRVDAARSAIYPERTKAFPRNTEVEVTLTFSGEQPGNFVREVAPTAESLTVRQHHSFVALPEPGYTPRRFDPRAGYFETSYMDYATPISEPIMKRLIERHRLQKRDPSARVSEPVKPIVYYLDRGTPEPIRTALLEGARWWGQAFEAAGFRNAFQVEMLPEGADPMDARYNVINWVHRSTRGWSYGSTITDPRTGEIIKGQVTLGSLRVRQDFLIAEGLLAPYEQGRPAPRDMQEMALARLRQLSAHEVGHTLGLAHNFAASVSQRASVMDYPHPLVGLGTDGKPTLKDAYTNGIGEWDKVAIAYGYGEFAKGADERQELDRLIQQAHAKGLQFLSDGDARPEGGAHPQAHLWDNGANAVEELDRMLRVRSAALQRFSENNIRTGAPLSTLEEVLVPLYMGHRYQVEATAKVLGGLRYTYALRGDGQEPTAMVPAAEQKRALEALLVTLQPSTLLLPERILRLIPPRPIGFDPSRELFKGKTGLTFDPLTAAESAATLTVRLLLNPERAARLVEQKARDVSAPGLAMVMDRLIAGTWKQPRETGLAAEVQRRVDSVVLAHLMLLVNNEQAAPQVRAIAQAQLTALRRWCETNPSTLAAEQAAHRQFAATQIERFLRDPKAFPVPQPVEPPPGQPIGCEP